MINQNITNVLGQINGITNTVVLKYPTTVVNSPAGDIIVKINMEELDSDKFEDIGIYNLNEFLSTFKLFSEDREVSINDKNIMIKSGSTEVNYISTNISLLDDFNKTTDAFTTTESVPTVAEFVLSSVDMKQLKQASGVFKDLSEISIISQDGNIRLNLGASNNFNAKSNGFSTNLNAETSKEFNIKVPTENFNMIPNSEYTVYVKYNSTRDAYRIILSSNEIDLKILLAVKK